MRSVESEGGSIDEAIARALDALRVARDQVEIEILENSDAGALWPRISQGAGPGDRPAIAGRDDPRRARRTGAG